MRIDITIIDKCIINKNKQLHQFDETAFFSIKKERPPLPKATFPPDVLSKMSAFDDGLGRTHRYGRGQLYG